MHHFFEMWIQGLFFTEGRKIKRIDCRAFTKLLSHSRANHFCFVWVIWFIEFSKLFIQFAQKRKLSIFFVHFTPPHSPIRFRWWQEKNPPAKLRVFAWIRSQPTFTFSKRIPTSRKMNMQKVSQFFKLKPLKKSF